MEDTDSQETDENKRKMRNLSEKKRRDQFNLLINELSSMVSTSTRKMDKSSVLKSTIAFLRNHNDQESEIALSSEAHQVEEDWKPPFLSNEEFAHVMLEALDGFIIAFATNGKISYVSESIASLLGYLPNEVLNMTIYDLVHEDSRSEFYEVLNSHSTNVLLDSVSEDRISFVLYMKRGPLDDNETAEQAYELVRFVGNYVQWQDGSYDHVLQSDHGGGGGGGGGGGSYAADNDRMQSAGEFVATVMLQTPQLLREMTLSSDDDVTRSEFTSRHSLEWKFLFLDPRAPPIIGYLPFEVLGTSGYDYYHVDDLEKIVACHEALMQTGEGTCSYYRFLTKGQQWLWLQTRYYITYHQWNSKPEFIVCTHMVVSCAEARLQLRKETSRQDNVKTSTSSSSLMQSSRNQRIATTLPQPASSHTSNQRTEETRASPHGTQEQNVGSASVLKHTSLNATTEKSSSVSGGSPRKGHAAFLGHSGHQRSTSCVKETPIQSGEHESNPFGKPSHSAMTQPMDQFAINQPTAQPLHHDCDQAIGNRAVDDANATIARQQQSDLQEQLRCKHQILQEQILQQQEKLQRIHEQLMFAQFAPQDSTAISTNENQQYETSGAFQPMPMVANPSTSSLENQEAIQFQFSHQDDRRMEFRDTNDDGQLDKRL